MNIIFMGSPEFAVPALQELLNSKHHIIAIYTQAPKPAGRGYKERRTPIHNLAVENNILVKTPINFKNQSIIDEFKNLQADIAIVVAYGIILPQAIIDATKYGCINIHPSNLPKYRGAAPIQHTILNGEKETAICIIQMDAGVDTGAILAKETLVLSSSTTTPVLHDLTASIGAKLMVKVIDNYHNISPIAQVKEGACYASKITKQQAKINWQEDDIDIIERKIRAFNPIPGTWFTFNDQIIKIKAAEIEKISHHYKFGCIINNDFSIACKGGILNPQILQREGKKAMPVAEFIKGYKIESGSTLFLE